MLIKIGDTGATVKEIQKLLGIIAPDGVFGKYTEKLVIEFQKSKGLKADGKVGNKTYALLNNLTTDVSETLVSDTDGQLEDKGVYTTLDGLNIHRLYLDTDEYVSDKGTTIKHTLFLHHTAGRSNPYQTVKNWNIDDRGRIATQFIIGGIDLNGNDEYDGVVIECFPDDYFAWHLGNVGSHEMHTHSIGIELNNWGYLSKNDNRFYNYVNIEVPKEQVCDLGYDFNGYRYYHLYTDKQLISLNLLIKEICRKHPQIDITNGLQSWLKTKTPKEAFGFNVESYNGKVKGLLTHTNVRKDKTDCSPQVNLLNLIRNL